MRIALITSAPFPPREGIGFHVWRLAGFLAARDWEVAILTRGRRCSREPAGRRITIWRLPCPPIYPFHAWLHGLFVARQVAHLEKDLDLIHLHSPLVAAVKTYLPTLITVHTPLRADIAAIPVSSPFSLLVHLQAPVSYGLERVLFKSGRLAAVAEHVASELGAYGIAPGRVEVVGNGVATEVFYPGTWQPGLAGGAGSRPYCLTVTRLAPRKGLEDLLACAALLRRVNPELRFLIAGEGPLRAQLERTISRLDLSRQVLLMGQVSQPGELANLYRGAAVYVHPARYEGLPTSLLEAMACGSPVVAACAPGAVELVRSGVDGLLVAPGDPQGMAHAIERLLADRPYARACGAQAAERAAAQFDWQVIGRRYLEVYRQILPEREG